ncbi:hypothetical protein R3P38DRAFT_3317132 [Favolaschia claudopus]|uniref:Antibiotic biosynthesis monooxygenase n=1 Tax=Favolaschia claudopus TaxID=2862362 RepID=A0AAW0BFD8_9AGAR
MENHVQHFAVIFTSKRRPQEGDGYPEMAAKMDALAREQPGFLGVDSVSSPVEGTVFPLPTSSAGTDLRSAITVSYWQDEESIRVWKRNLEHLLAQKRGKEKWYLHYEVRVAKVERMYSGDGISE